MEITETRLKGVLLRKPAVHGDRRGFFMETWRKEDFADVPDFVQDNLSLSRRNTIRGLHYQIEQQQDKLVMVMEGEILDVAVDLRRGSDTFGEWTAHRLSSENRHQLYIPKGFAHGFSVLSEEALVFYKCSNYYHPEGERGLLWADPQLNIDWAVEEPVISDKDQQQPLLIDIPEKDLFQS